MDKFNLMLYFRDNFIDDHIEFVYLKTVTSTKIGWELKHEEIEIGEKKN